MNAEQDALTDQQAFDQVAALDERRRQATLQHDFDTVAGIIGSTLRYVHGSGVDEDRDLYLQRLRDGYYRYYRMDVLRQDFRRFGATVLVHGDMRIHLNAGDVEKDFKGRYLQVWVMQQQAWKMVAWETTPLRQ